MHQQSKLFSYRSCISDQSAQKSMKHFLCPKQHRQLYMHNVDDAYYWHPMLMLLISPDSIPLNYLAFIPPVLASFIIMQLIHKTLVT